MDCQVRGERFELGRDEALTLAATGTPRRSRVNGVQESAWRRSLLISEGAPLRQVVEQINLYRGGRVILSNEAIASLPVNAVFHISQVNNAVSQLELLQQLRARRIAAGVVLLG